MEITEEERKEAGEYIADQYKRLEKYKGIRGAVIIEYCSPTDPIEKQIQDYVRITQKEKELVAELGRGKQLFGNFLETLSTEDRRCIDCYFDSAEYAASYD